MISDHQHLHLDCFDHSVATIKSKVCARSAERRSPSEAGDGSHPHFGRRGCDRNTDRNFATFKV